MSVTVDAIPRASERPFRFGVNLVSPATRKEWQATCREAEDLGYDVIAVADHLGMPSPFPALLSAAEATTRPRVSAFVLNTGFTRPALLARDIATLDLLTDGRLETALGAGYVKAEFDAADVPWTSPGRRVDHLEACVVGLRERLTDPGHHPQPVQRPAPPVLVAGNGNRVLALAARHADIIGFVGAAPASAPGTMRLLGPDALAGRVDLTRRLLAAAGRDAEFNLLVHAVAPDGDRRRVYDALGRFPEPIIDDDLAEAPSILAGSAAGIAETLHSHREHYGITYFTVPQPFMRSFARTIAAMT